jgi:hypothetical protein
MWAVGGDADHGCFGGERDGDLVGCGDEFACSGGDEARAWAVVRVGAVSLDASGAQRGCDLAGGVPESGKQRSQPLPGQCSPCGHCSFSSSLMPAGWPGVMSPVVGAA